MGSGMRAFFSLIHTGSGVSFAWVPNTLALFELDSQQSALAQSILSTSKSEGSLDHMPAALTSSERVIWQNFVDTGLISASAAPEPIPPQPIPMGFRIVLTEKCNLRCLGCFSTTALIRAGAPLRTMTSNTLQSVVHNVVKPWMKDSELDIHFFGGEPMLQYTLIRQAVDAFDELARSGLRAPRYGVTTNGTVLNDDQIAFLAKHKFDIGVSIELSESIHNSARPAVSGMKSYNVASSAFDRLEAAGCQPHILITPYSPLPDDAVVLFGNLLKRFPSRKITINTPFDDTSLAWLESEEHLKFLTAAHRVGHQHNVVVDSALSPIVAAIAMSTPRFSPQAVSGTSIMLGIAPDGKVVRSTQRFDPRYEVGQNGPHMLSTFADACSDCVARFVCGGPNEEFQATSGEVLDFEKCSFHLRALQAICDNLDIFAFNEVDRYM